MQGVDAGMQGVGAWFKVPLFKTLVGVKPFKFTTTKFDNNKVYTSLNRTV